MERNDKTIFISITILFIVMTLLNGYIYFHHFTQADKGVEAWVENITIVNNPGDKEIFLDFTIINLYDYHVQYMYSIYSDSNEKNTCEILNSILLGGNDEQTIHGHFYTTNSAKSLNIHITNGEYDINLIIKKI